MIHIENSSVEKLAKIYKVTYQGFTRVGDHLGKGEKMKLYIDTGNVDAIKEAMESGLVDGITTNPTWIAKEGKDFRTLIKQIENIVGKTKKEFTVSAEVHSLDWQGMVKEGLAYAKWGPHVIIKIPLTEDGLIAVQKLAAKKIKCNVTLCFSANQALLAAKAGAWCVSPFVGRLDRAGQNGIDLIHEIRTIYDNFGYKTRILVASVHDPIVVKESALAGADMVTMMPDVFAKMFKHPFTDQGLDTFMKDYNKYRVQMEQHHK